MHLRQRVNRAARRPFCVLIVGLSVAASLTACGSNGVSAVPANGAHAPICQQVAAAWPKSVANQSAVKVDIDREQAEVANTVAAWGDPAIIARCGVTSPGPTTADCIDVSGIDWVGRTLDDGMAFVTYGRSPAIEVLVPEKYSPEPTVLGAFTAAAGRISQGSHRCTGPADVTG